MKVPKGRLNTRPATPGLVILSEREPRERAVEGTARQVLALSPEPRSDEYR